MIASAEGGAEERVLPSKSLKRERLPAVPSVATSSESETSPPRPAVKKTKKTTPPPPPPLLEAEEAATTAMAAVPSVATSSESETSPPRPAVKKTKKTTTTPPPLLEAEEAEKEEAATTMTTEPPRRIQSGRCGDKSVDAAIEEWVEAAAKSKAGRDVFVLVARKMTPRFFETAAAERADCRFYLAKNGDLFVVKVPSWEHGDLVGELLKQSGNYLDSLVPPALQDLACAGDAANMATGVGTVREPDIRVTPRGAPPPPPPFTKLPRVIIDLEWKHRSPRVIREYGHELLSTHADVRAFVSIYAHRNPTGSVVAAAAMWQKTLAGGIVLSDAVSFGTVDLSAKTKAHFAAAAFGGGGAVLLPPVPNLAAAGVVTWRTALHLPVPAPAAEFRIPATQVLYNIRDPATGVAAVIPAALPDLVLNFRAMLRKIL